MEGDHDRVGFVVQIDVETTAQDKGSPLVGALELFEKFEVFKLEFESYSRVGSAGGLGGFPGEAMSADPIFQPAAAVDLKMVTKLVLAQKLLVKLGIAGADVRDPPGADQAGLVPAGVED